MKEQRLDSRTAHPEQHHSGRIGWLRAAVLGANDGIVSTAALVVGVAASGASHAAVLTSGIAGAVAGAMSMAAGEYVSVKSQADAETADLAIERRELEEKPRKELRELAGIYVKRGLSPELARRVAEELTARDALDAHARDELGITDAQRARPIQAALASATSFIAGASLPLAGVVLASSGRLEQTTILLTLISLLMTGALAAYTGGAPILRGALRLVFWGAAGVGRVVPAAEAGCDTAPDGRPVPDVRRARAPRPVPGVPRVARPVRVGSGSREHPCCRRSRGKAPRRPPRSRQATASRGCGGEWPRCAATWSVAS